MQHAHSPILISLLLGLLLLTWSGLSLDAADADPEGALMLTDFTPDTPRAQS